MAYQFQLRYPLDSYPYARDPRSQPLAADTSSGSYVFLRDPAGVLQVVPDGLHRHPTILGLGLPATYAGDLTIISGVVTDVTNCSGTFRFDDRDGLREVARQMVQLGLVVATGAVRFFPPDGGLIEVLE